MEIEDEFSAGQNADINYRSEQLPPGKYVVQITRILRKVGYQGKSYIVEYQVAESSNAEVPVESKASWVNKLDKVGDKADMTWANLKAFMFALALNVDPRKAPTAKKDPELHGKALQLLRMAVYPDLCEKAGIAPDFLVGRKVRVETRKTMTKGTPGNPPHEFTVHEWAPFVAVS